MLATGNQTYGLEGGKTRVVSSVKELVDAVASNQIFDIFVKEDLQNVPPFRLGPGQGVHGYGGIKATLSFANGCDGIELSSDNHLSCLRVYTEGQRCAVWTSEESPNFGYMRIENIETRGRVSITIKKQTGTVHLDVKGLHIDVADSTQVADRPTGFGVSVLQGAFTLWNKRSSREPVATADLRDISVGRPGAPALGSGVFVCGAGHEDCSLRIEHLKTGSVYSNGNIPAGTADLISGGVFIVHGTSVDVVENRGSVVTFGPNDMALDNWGTVDRWIAREKVTTYGPSAIGFVNFGSLDRLAMHAPIETHGTGARGYNVYSGTVRQASFDRIVTRGDGAVGIQISQPVGPMQVRRGIETHGGRGLSLVKGVLQELSAIALSIKPGGKVESIRVSGGLISHGHDVPVIEQGGEVGRLVIEGGFCNRGAETAAQGF